MIRTGNLVHKGLVNIRPGVFPEANELNDMTFGNKIALLSGDYLLANSSAELAALKNQDVSYYYFLYFCFTYSIIFQLFKCR